MRITVFGFGFAVGFVVGLAFGFAVGFVVGEGFGFDEGFAFGEGFGFGFSFGVGFGFFDAARPFPAIATILPRNAGSRSARGDARGLH